MKKKSKWIKRVIAAVLVLAILAGLGILGWFLYGRQTAVDTDPPKVGERYEADKVLEELERTGAKYFAKDSDGKLSYYELNNGKLRMRLYVNTTAFELAELNPDGTEKRVWKSNPMNLADGTISEQNETVTNSTSKLNEMRSTLIVSYSQESADKDLNSWEYSIDKQAYNILYDENNPNSISVKYAIGFISSVSKIPLVLTGEKYSNLKERFDANVKAIDTYNKEVDAWNKEHKDDKRDKLSAAKFNTFSSNYLSWTIRDLLLGKYDAKTGKLTQASTPENRQLAAHLIETKIADDALNSDSYRWVQDAINALNNASIVGYDREAALAMIEAHAAEMDAETLETLRALAETGTEEERREAADRIREIPDPETAGEAAAAETASEPAEAAETEESEEAEETEEAEADWRIVLADNFECPDVETFSAEKLLAVLEAHREETFFASEEWYSELVQLIQLDPEIIEREELKTDEAAYAMAAERMEARITEAELAKPENAWARELIDMITADTGDGFNAEGVTAKIDALAATANAEEYKAIDLSKLTFADLETLRGWSSLPKESKEALLAKDKLNTTEDKLPALTAEALDSMVLKKTLSVDTYYVSKFLTSNAKANMLLGLQGGDMGRARYVGIDYTEEEYLKDAKWAMPAEEDTTVLYNVTVNYTLDADNFVVEVPYSEIRCNAEAPITYLTVLPYFGAVGHEGNKDANDNYAYDNGFILVPEGGGALIRYNNGKIQQNNYIANMYGWDYASKRSEVISETKTVFPVFGMTYSDHKNTPGSFICIIEQGAGFAAVQADINGQTGIRSAFHLNSYNMVNAKYHVLHSDQYNVSAKTANMVIMYERDTKDEESIVQRYCFLDSNNYVDMANAYGDYLRTHTELGTRKASDEVPVSVELVGAIDKKVVVAGLPTNQTVPITTFKQAQEIIGSLLDGGVKNLNVRMSGWSNGGVNQKVLTGVSVEGGLGGATGMTELIRFAKENKVPLYFDGVTTFAYRSGLTNGFVPNRDAARYTTNEEVEIYPYSQIVYTSDEDRDVFYLVRPDFAFNTAANLIRFLQRQGAEGVAFRDIGTLLSGNYDPNDTTTREQVRRMQVATLMQARANYQRVMIKEGFDFVMPYADIITDMDLSGIPYSILDESVPFYQIAMHGAMDYTGDALNLSDDLRTALLHCAEYGAGLNFTFMYKDGSVLQDTLYTNYFGANWSKWEKDVLEMVTKYQEDMKGLNRSRIVGHMTLPQGVKLTVYENGTRVYVNYSDMDYALPGRGAKNYIGQGKFDGLETVVPARSYVVTRDDGVDLELKQESTGAYSLVNYSGEDYFTGDGRKIPAHTTTRVTDGKQAEVIFLENGSRVYLNTGSEPITVAGGTVLQPGEMTEAVCEDDLEVIFTADGRCLYINNTDTDMLAGRNGDSNVTLKAGGKSYLYTEALGLDAVIAAPAPVEEPAAEETAETAETEPAETETAQTETAAAEEPAGEPAEEPAEEPVPTPEYRLFWINATNEELTVDGEAVPAKSVLLSESTAFQQVAFRPDGSRLYINRGDADMGYGDSNDPKVTAHNTALVTGDGPFDMFLMDGTELLLINNTDEPMELRSSEQQTELTLAPRSAVKADRGALSFVDAIFLADGRTVLIHGDNSVNGRVVRYGAGQSDTLINGRYKVIEARDIPTAILNGGANPNAPSDPDRKVFWLNPTEEAFEMAGDAVPAKSLTEATVDVTGFTLVNFPEKHERVILNLTGTAWKTMSGKDLGLVQTLVHRTADNATIHPDRSLSWDDTLTRSFVPWIDLDPMLDGSGKLWWVNTTAEDITVADTQGEQVIPAGAKVENTLADTVIPFLYPNRLTAVMVEPDDSVRLETVTDEKVLLAYINLGGKVNARSGAIAEKGFTAAEPGTDLDITVLADGRLLLVNTANEEIEAFGAKVPAGGFVTAEPEESFVMRAETMIQEAEEDEEAAEAAEPQEVALDVYINRSGSKISTLSGDIDAFALKSVSGRTALDAAVLEDGSLYWINPTEEPIEILGETVPATGVARSGQTDELLMYFLPDEVETAAAPVVASGSTKEVDKNQIHFSWTMGWVLGAVLLLLLAVLAYILVIKPGKPYSRKKLIVFGVLAALALALIVFSVINAMNMSAEIKADAEAKAAEEARAAEEAAAKAAAAVEVLKTDTVGRVYINRSGVAISATSGNIDAASVRSVRDNSSADIFLTEDNRLWWVNNTDEDLVLFGETAKARGLTQSQLEDTLLVYFPPETADATRVYVNRTDKPIRSIGGEIGAMQIKKATDSNDLDILVLSETELVLVNTTFEPLTVKGLGVTVEPRSEKRVTVSEPFLTLFPEAEKTETAEAEAAPAEEEKKTPVTRLYVNLTGEPLIRTVTKVEDEVRTVDETEIASLGVLRVSDTTPLDIIRNEAYDLWWVNSTDAEVTAGGTAVPAKANAPLTDLQGAALEVLILPEGGCLLINRGEAAVTVGDKEIAPGKNLKLDDPAETLPWTVDALIINLTDTEATIGETTLAPFGCGALAGVPLPDEPPAEETPADTEETTKEGGDGE